MKLNKLIKARSALSKHSDEPLPTRLAYKILKFMKASDTEGAFYDEKLKDIINRYGQKDESGNIIYVNGNISIQSDCVQECQKAIEELGETEVSAPEITFNIQELTPINFTVSELFLLDEIIEEE